MITYPTRTAATKAKKPGREVYRRKDGMWAIRVPKAAKANTKMSAK